MKKYVVLISCLGMYLHLQANDANNVDSINTESSTISNTNTINKDIIENNKNKTTFDFSSSFGLGSYGWGKKYSNNNISSTHSNSILSNSSFTLGVNNKITKNIDSRISISSYTTSSSGDKYDSKLAIISDDLWVRYKNKNLQFVIGRQEASNVWGGRNNIQFSSWNHDGLSFSYKFRLNPKVNLVNSYGLFIENNDVSDFFKQGHLYGLSFNIENNNKNYIHSIGFANATKMRNDYKGVLGNFNYGADLADKYSILMYDYSHKFNSSLNTMFSLGIYRNIYNYRNNPKSTKIKDAEGNNSFSKKFNPTTAPDFTKQRTGFYVGVSSLMPFNKKLKLSGGYIYMQKYAAMDHFSKSACGWSKTNCKGIYLNSEYKLNKKVKLKGKVVISSDIKGLRGDNPNFLRTGGSCSLNLEFNL